VWKGEISNKRHKIFFCPKGGFFLVSN
jgi:hypothetical protein